MGILTPLVDGEPVPFGLAIAYYDPIEDVYWAAPVGLHWLVRAIRRAWEWCACYEMSDWEFRMRHAVEQQILDSFSRQETKA